MFVDTYQMAFVLYSRWRWWLDGICHIQHVTWVAYDVLVVFS